MRTVPKQLPEPVAAFRQAPHRVAQRPAQQRPVAAAARPLKAKRSVELSDDSEPFFDDDSEPFFDQDSESLSDSARDGSDGSSVEEGEDVLYYDDDSDQQQ